MDLDESSELLTFHEAISNLVESEEKLVEEHKAIIEADQHLLSEEELLLQYVEDPDHDIEQYVTHMEKIVSKKLERLTQFKGQSDLITFFLYNFLWTSFIYTSYPKFPVSDNLRC